MAHGTGAAWGEWSELRLRGERTEREEWDGKKTEIRYLSREAGGVIAGLALDAGRPYVVCSKWLSPGPTQVETMPRVTFRAAIETSGELKIEVAV